MVTMRPEPWKTSKMSGDRKKLLMQWSNAKAAAANPQLPEHIRTLARSARDKAAVVLGMQDAAARAEARQAAKTSSDETPRHSSAASVRPAAPRRGRVGRSLHVARVQGPADAGFSAADRAPDTALAKRRTGAAIPARPRVTNRH
jgi:hypothetical protein